MSTMTMTMTNDVGDTNGDWPMAVDDDDDDDRSMTVMRMTSASGTHHVWGQYCHLTTCWVTPMLTDSGVHHPGRVHETQRVADCSMNHATTSVAAPRGTATEDTTQMLTDTNGEHLDTTLTESGRGYLAPTVTMVGVCSDPWE
eukprot:gnl/Dysnectes_brevis/953_a1062_5744.p2 GENE.gnl/Dysnectes_brevis/953_a1062_5744~~gnl/Dysnectes_brevis/953_a1062_5744.p2  ORF type:complete len:143 (-),score=12.09 gnl/Dysnectes_brevis/953_a1062_5744:369-797(-)